VKEVDLNISMEIVMEMLFFSFSLADAATVSRAAPNSKDSSLKIF